MKRAALLLSLVFAFAVNASAQEKGVDHQNQRIRETGSGRTPGVNGRNVESGSGRGIDFGKGRTPTRVPLANPYRFSFPNDVLLQAIEELLLERQMLLDEGDSKIDVGVLVSQPYTFSKGAVVTESELNRLANVPAGTNRGWTRGRYTLVIEVQPIDNGNSQVAVNARIEGRSESVTGAEWVTMPSNGVVEEEFLVALIEKVTGGAPPEREPQQP